MKADQDSIEARQGSVQNNELQKIDRKRQEQELKKKQFKIPIKIAEKKSQKNENKHESKERSRNNKKSPKRQGKTIGEKNRKHENNIK